MARTARDLSDLAEAVADGEPVDWEAAERLAVSPEDRRAIRRLRMVARVAGTYRDAGNSDGSFAARQSETIGPATVQPARLAPGVRWGGLQVIDWLGAGTFGDVYRARDPRLDRDVALKLLRVPPDDGDASEAVNEGRLLARVRHPNVVSVYGADRIDRRVGLWMEFIDGRTLEQELRERGRCSVEETTAIGIDLSRALAAVHAAGLLHRDVKAQNVMRDSRDGRLVLMDFSAGRERSAGADDDGQMPPSLAGSPIYLAPEVLDGQHPTERSDVYSLGVLLFRIVSGEFPLKGSTLAEIREAHAAGARARLADVQPDLPQRFVDVVERAIAADPSMRFASASEMERGLLAAVADRGRATHRLRWWVAGTVAAVLTTAAFWFVSKPGEAIDKPLATADLPVVLVGAAQGLPDRPDAATVLEGAVARALADSGFVVPSSRERNGATLALMRRPPDTRLEAPLAREVAARDGGITAVLISEVRTAGNAYALVTQILTPEDGSLIATVRDDLSRVPADGDARRHAGRVRDALRSQLPSIARPDGALERVTTASLNALGLYTRGSALIAQAVETRLKPRAAVFGAAETLLRQAVALDSEFASAWFALAQAIYGAGPRSLDYQPYMEQAMALADRASERERLEILGWTHFRRADISGDRRELEQAVRIYETYLREYPTSSHVVVRDMTMYVGYGADVRSVLEAAYRELGRTEDADRITLELAALHPGSIRLQVEASRVFLRQGLLAQSQEAAQRAAAAGETESPDRLLLDIGWARLWDVHAAWLRNDSSAALEALRRVQQRWPVTDDSLRMQTGWPRLVWKVYEGLGRFKDAENLQQGTENLATRRRDLAYLTLISGDVSRARDLLRPQLAEFDQANGAMSLTVWAGLTGKADWIVSERRKRGLALPWMQRSADEGQLRVAHGRYAEGLALLEPLMSLSAYGHGWIYPRSREAVAIARRAQGDLTGAIEALSTLDSVRPAAVSYQWWTSDWLRCRTLLAELHHEAGHLQEAIRIAAEVRQLLAVADDHNPLIARLDRLPLGR